MSRSLVGACFLTAALCMTACGADDTVDDGTGWEDPVAAPDDVPWVPEEPGGNGPPSGGLRDPCERAMCWDLDKRSWVVDPPPDYVIVGVEEYVDPDVPLRPDGEIDPAAIRVRINIRATAR